jgi:aspartate racemase
MEEVISQKKSDDEQGLIDMIFQAVESLTLAGIDGLLLCANTLHFAADRIAKEFDVPIIHIAEATADVIRKDDFSKLGLLGTKQTMEQDFYTSVLQKRGIETIVPNEADRIYLDKIIFSELANDVIAEETRRKVLGIMNKLSHSGAEGIVLGCTELPLLIRPEHTSIPMFDTLSIHVNAAIDFALR